MHRDLKPENILAFENDHLKITDFGISRIISTFMQGQARTNAGSIGYIAPEVGNDESYTYKADIYSLGAVLYYMTHQRTPKVAEIAENRLTYNTQIYSAGLKDFNAWLLSINVNDRPDIDEVINDRFFRRHI